MFKFPICCLGFSCPYRGCSTEGDSICIHPYHPNDPTIELETFGLLEDMSYMDCPLMDPDGELMKILDECTEVAYNESMSGLYR